MLATLLTLIHLSAATMGTVHALVYKRDPRAATGWVAVCIFVPFVGPLAYSVLGINRVRARAQTLKRSRFAVSYERGAAPLDLDSTSAGLRGIGARLTSFALHAGNRVTVLHNGDEAYPAMLAAIDSAERSIVMATYVFNLDEIGTAFADALARARDRGVAVAVLVDGIGELYSRPRSSSALRRRGIQAARFLPPRLMPPSLHLNLRNHRKILVIDGRTAFVGGMNISADNTIDASERRSIADLHFSIEGPIAADIERMGHDDWYFATAERLDPTSFDPEAGNPTLAGDAECRLIVDGPDEALDRLTLLILGTVSAATTQIDIMTPYFVPNRELIAALQTAALRGVRVRVVLPGKSNLFYMDWANRNMLAELLPWSIEIYYQPPPFCHSKLLLVDDEYVLLGSANLDPRSLRLNFELGVEVWSSSLSRALRVHVNSAIAMSRRVPLDELDARGLPVRVRDSAASLLSPYL